MPMRIALSNALVKAAQAALVAAAAVRAGLIEVQLER